MQLKMFVYSCSYSIKCKNYIQLYIYICKLQKCFSNTKRGMRLRIFKNLMKIMQQIHVKYLIQKLISTHISLFLSLTNKFFK